MRTLLPKEVRVAIIRMCRVFTRLCAKSVDPLTMAELLEETTTMCMLEKFFPQSFFDVMSHMPIHLVQQLVVCGPVHTRWMYPVERYLKTLKGYIRQHTQPEGSMARGYIMDEALGFCTEYMQNCSVTTRRVWDDTKEPCMNSELLEGKGRRRTSPIFFFLYVLNYPHNLFFQMMPLIFLIFFVIFEIFLINATAYLTLWVVYPITTYLPRNSVDVSPFTLVCSI